MSSVEPAWSIREYRAADFRELCAIDGLCFPPGVAYTSEEMALGLAQAGAAAWVAENADGVIAFVLAGYGRRNLGHIITIDVLPAFRRTGLGKRLMSLAEQSLKALGARRIVLEVNVENHSAIRFYEGLGYLARGTIANYYSDGSDAILMQKTFPL